MGTDGLLPWSQELATGSYPFTFVVNVGIYFLHKSIIAKQSTLHVDVNYYYYYYYYYYYSLFYFVKH
jgi:hypothetical protein